MMLGYISDLKVKENLNKQGQNCWEAYIAEILNQAGVGGTRLDIAQANADNLSKFSVLILGSQSGRILPLQVIDAIRQWVTKGGVLVGFAAHGMNDIFGIQSHSALKQTNDHEVCGRFDLWKHPLTDDIHPLIFLEQRLPIVSDIELVSVASAQILAGLYRNDGMPMAFPAITWNLYGRGYAGYFAFDLAKTVWLLHQGRPCSDIVESRRAPRANEMCIVPPDAMKVPSADEMILILQNMIAHANFPMVFIHQIPPKDGSIADAILYWGGDEYKGPVELSIESSDWMKSKGLPYHINIEPENHPMTKDEYEHIRNNGHEVSAYYILYENVGYAMNAEVYQRQAETFKKRFGISPCATVNFLLRWKDWASPAKWMKDAGGRADNSFSSLPMLLSNHPLAPEGMHPMANGSFFGFGFGTAFPFYFYDDFVSGNERIDFMEQPITCYELGHYSLIPCKYDDRLQDPQQLSYNLSDVHLAIDMAIKYHHLMNMFVHPVNIARRLSGRQAIEEVLRYCDYRNAVIVHMGNDDAAKWWDARTASTVSGIETDGMTTMVRCHCAYAGGMILKLPLKKNTAMPARVMVNGRKVVFDMRWEFGGDWLYVVVPAGQSLVEIT